LINAASSSSAFLSKKSRSQPASSSCIAINLEARSCDAVSHAAAILSLMLLIVFAESSIALVNPSTSFSLSDIASQIASNACLNTCSVILAASFCCLALSFSASLSIFASSFCLSDSIFSSSLASFSAAILAADLPHPPPELVLVPHTGVTNDSAHTDCAFCLSHCSAAEILSIPSALSNHFCTFNADINT
jgi:hypothetical protein